MKKDQVARGNVECWVVRAPGIQTLLNNVGLIEDVNYYLEMVGSTKIVTL